MSEVEQAAEVTEAKRIWSSCYSCRDYAEHRRDAIAVPLADKARREGRDIVEVVDEFMLDAHRRHMAGKPLREGGPTRLTDPAIGRLAAILSPGLFSPNLDLAHRPVTPADSTRAVGHE